MSQLAEKYRPTTFDDVIGQEHVVTRLRAWATDYHAGKADMPHLLFEGPAGTGKTTLAHVLARSLYGNDWKTYVLDLNASNDRGINVVREKIKNFARLSALGQQFNLIILDEFDAMTPDAQDALRRVMEDYKTVRFVLALNKPTKVIPPIKNRCASFHFKPIPESLIRDALRRVLKAEAVDFTEDGLTALAKASNGSMRGALNFLQSVQPPLTADRVPATLAGGATRPVVDLVVKGEVREAEKALLLLMRGEGVAADALCNDFFDVIDGLDLPAKTVNKLLMALGDREYRVATGGNPEIQLRCFLRHAALILGGEK